MQTLPFPPLPRRGRAWASCALTALVLAGVCSLLLASAATAANFSWSGEGSASADTWSNGANWTGGTAPAVSSTIGTLAFPVLSRSACLQATPSEACYTSNNDLTGLSVNALQVDDSHDYGILGNGFTLGSGGLSINSSEGAGGSFFNINFSIINPITLSSSQTWSVSGPATTNEWPAQNIAIRSTLTGASSDLTVNLNSLTNFVLGIDVPGAPSVDDEIGSITVNGSEATIGSSTYKYKSRVVIAPNAKLNATDGHSLTLHHVDLEGGEAIGPINAEGSYITEPGTVGAITANESQLELSGATGPITATGSSLELSGSSIGTVSAVKSTVSPNGTVSLPAMSLDAVSTLGTSIHIQESATYSQITSTGTLALGGARLALHISETEGCPLPHVGQVYTVISTTGSLTGTFGNAPNGSIIYADCTPGITQGPGPEAYASPYRISYNTSSSPETVTATALPAVPTPNTTEPKAPSISGSTIEGQTLTESHGSWNNSPTSYAYQWQDCDSSGNNCSNIAGATGQTYTLTSADVGHTIRVQETASNADGTSSPAGSAPTAAVQATSSSGGTTAGSQGGGTSSGSGTGSSGSTASISAAQVKASLARQLMPQGKGAKTASLLKSGGYLLPFTALEAGTVVVKWYLVPHGAKLAKKAKRHSKAKPILVASGKLAFAGAGSGKIKLRLTAAGKRLLKHAKRLKLVAKATFTATGSQPVSAVKSLVLRR